MSSGDPEFKRFVTRAVVPIVGSTGGLNGARFKTYLRLRDAGIPAQGRVIFHQAGRAAMGQTGIGWLEIVPDPGTPSLIPYADVRLFNEMPDATTFGGFENDVLVPSFYNKTFTGYAVPAARFRTTSASPRSRSSTRTRSPAI